MKTWWHLGPGIILFTLVPFIIGLIPTFNLRGKYVGGGPIREYFINTVAHFLSDEKAAELIEMFINASVVTEYLLYLPIALNLSLIVLLISYSFGFTLIELSNYFSTNIYKSQRNRAKGA